MIQHYRSKPGVPSQIRVVAVALTPRNVAEVAEWCGGEVVDQSVMVPVMVPVGDANKGRSRIVPEARQATRNDFVVKWQDRFHVVNHEAFTNAYDEVPLTSKSR